MTRMTDQEIASAFVGLIGTNLARAQDCDPHPLTNELSVWCAMHIDGDYHQFWLVELRLGETGSGVDYLFVHDGPGCPADELDVLSLNEPHHFFDAGSRSAAVAHRFVDWVYDRHWDQGVG